VCFGSLLSYTGAFSSARLPGGYPLACQSRQDGLRQGPAPEKGRFGQDETDAGPRTEPTPTR
jgi:hypothetical protein